MKKLITFAAVMVVALVVGFTQKGDNKVVVSSSPTGSVSEAGLIELESENNEITTVEVVVMGSSLEFAVFAPKDKAYEAISEAVKEIKALEARITSWKPNSEIFILNENSGEAIPLSEETYKLVKKAVEESEITNGAFDISVGAIWDLYPFRDKNRVPPTDEEISEALPLVGYKKVVFDDESLKVTLPKGMKINLGAIGKGEAVNKGLEVFDKHGIHNVAISAGGDLTARGSKGNQPWTIDIEDPSWEGKTKMRVQVSDMSIATSGDSKRYFVYDGKKYGHIIDPRTGHTVTNMLSATVIAKDPAKADAYATAVYVMGIEDGLAWAESLGNIKAMVIDNNGHTHTTSNWEE